MKRAGYKERENKRKDFIALKKQGLSYAQIGQMFNISAQRVHHIVNKKEITLESIAEKKSLIGFLAREFLELKRFVYENKGKK